jgi:two-component system, OmpR family, response regulator
MNDTKTVLVVNDDPAMQDLLNAFPAVLQWRVETVPDSTEALKRIRAKPDDLVVTGLGTSGQSDVELLLKMRAVRPHVKLIVLAKESTPDVILESMRAHAFSYFSGPFDTPELCAMIERALDEPAWDDGIEIISLKPEWISLRLTCRMVTVERVIQFMRELRTDLHEKEREEIGVAFREMLLNAVEHGGKFDPAQTVEMTRARTARTVVYLIRDPGEGFCLTNLPQSALSNPGGEPFAHSDYRTEHGMRPGGFGILLSKGLVDELIYSEKGNEVVLIKYVTSSSV